MKFECPSCWGEGHHGLDDEGKPFACFRCGGSGTVAGISFDEMPADPEYRRLQGLRYMPSWGEYEADEQTRKLFTRFVRPERAPALWDYSMDIPF